MLQDHPENPLMKDSGGVVQCSTKEEDRRIIFKRW
jgi:hypothetical protein